MNPTRTHWTDRAIDKIIKHGPWACLSLLILGFIGVEARWFVHTTGAAVTDYVQTSGENVKALSANVALLSANLASTSRQVDRCSQLLDEVQKTHDNQVMQSDQIISLMDAAHTMMAPVPAKHDNELRILSEIRDKIQSPPPSAGFVP